MRPKFDVPPEHLVDAAMSPSAVLSRLAVLFGSAILIRGFRADPGRQDARQLKRVAGPKLVEARRTVIAEATQTTDQLLSDFDVRAAQVPEAAPDAVGPIEHRKGGPRETLELGLVGILECDDRSKEVDVLGFFGYEQELQGSSGHGHRYPPDLHVAEWQRKHRYVTSFPARSVCPRQSRGEPDRPVDCSIAFGQPGIVELVDPVEGQGQTEGEIAIDAHRTARLEQQREELHSVTEIGLMEVCVPDDAFAAITGHIEPFEQTLDRISQRLDRLGPGRPGPRGLVEYEAGVHELRLRRTARAARST